MTERRCGHQWSVWQGDSSGDTEIRWCHVCNAREERPKERLYQVKPDGMTEREYRRVRADAAREFNRRTAVRLARKQIKVSKGRKTR